jgi:probable F420-dependent oxidoreductase
VCTTLPSFSAADPGSWQHLLDRARAADQAGVDRVLVTDRVVFGENLQAFTRSELGGMDGGQQPTGPDGLWLDPLTALSVVCGVTTRVRLATNILLAALRRPVVLAKMAATLDVLSGGRLDLGVGTGWQREEYQAAGLDFGHRGQLLDHTLAVCQTLWRDTPARFDSPELHFEQIHCMPKPAQPGGVPIWVSGTLSTRVLDRLVRFGSGWIPWGPFLNDPVSGIATVRKALSAAGREVDGFQVRGRLPVVWGPGGEADLARTMEGVPGLIEAGITDFDIPLPIPRDPSAATDYLSQVVRAFREVVGRS